MNTDHIIAINNGKVEYEGKPNNFKRGPFENFSNKSILITGATGLDLLFRKNTFI